MRDFAVTAEPSGDARDIPADKLPFVIQKHAASHLHYDFRLGWNGVLKSWACAKGPSYVVADKRLAGRGRRSPDGVWRLRRHHPGRAVRRRHRDGVGPGHVGAAARPHRCRRRTARRPVEVHHARHQNARQVGADPHQGACPETWRKEATRWSKSTKPNWLLIKEHDEFEQPSEAAAVVTEAEPNSAVTGRSLEQIAAKRRSRLELEGNQRRPASLVPPRRKRRPKRRREKRREKRASRPGRTGQVQARQPRSGHPRGRAQAPSHGDAAFLPQAAARDQETEAPPAAPGWLHELKLDGYRMQARKQGAKVQMLTRSGLDWTDRVRAVANEVATAAH